MTLLAQDLRYAARSLRRSPGFTIVAILTLGLGLGATAAIFTLLNAVVLQPLPYPEPDRLVDIGTRWPGVNADMRIGISPANYFYFRDHSRALEDVGIYHSTEATITGDDHPERVRVVQASAGVLRALRARPELGRIISDDDDQPASTAPGSVAPGPSAPVAVLSHDFWARRYGGDPNIIGKTIWMDSRAVPIVGVLEAGVQLPDQDVDVWQALGLNPVARATNWHTFGALARLRPGVTLDQARSELAAISSRVVELFPTAYSDAFMKDTGFRFDVASMRSIVLGDVGRSMWILFGTVGLVLLIACFNVANLFLARTEGRQQETAIRMALGARSAQLARHYLTESALLALFAAALGIAFAWGAVQMLLAFSPSWIPRLSMVRLGWESVAFTVLISLAAAAAFGLFPVVAARRTAEESRRGGARGSTATRKQHAVRSTLVVVQMALALVLLAAAGLMLRSFGKLRSVDTGVSPEGILTMQLHLPSQRYGSYEQVSAFYRELTSRLEGLPGIARASVTTALPLAEDGFGCNAVGVEDHPPTPNVSAPCVPVSAVSPGFFSALGISVRGRIPTWSDVESRSGAVVVSKALAQRFWPGEDPIGKGVRGNGWGQPFYRVVGVTEDVRYNGLDKPPAEMVYFPLVPMEGAPLWSPERSVTLVVKSTSAHPEQLAATVRRTLADIDSDIPLANVRTMDDVVAKSMARTSLTMLLLAIAGGMALVLAAVGLYGVISYIVSRRTREIGIRVALGAQVTEVIRSVTLQSLRLSLVGTAAGVMGALLLTRFLRSMLYDVSPTDPAVLAGVSLVLVAVALAASYLPARRAAKIDPVAALRAE
ncbi:MAG TPA: ABC transporter permease [Gemmatimonadaceae bacterium]|nr:ABC transporter permease [Gemmatimonadaceae bacterium]